VLRIQDDYPGSEVFHFESCSRKYYLGCLFHFIPDLDFFHPGASSQEGVRSRIRNTAVLYHLQVDSFSTNIVVQQFLKYLVYLHKNK